MNTSPFRLSLLVFLAPLLPWFADSHSADVIDTIVGVPEWEFLSGKPVRKFLNVPGGDGCPLSGRKFADSRRRENARTRIRGYPIAVTGRTLKRHQQPSNLLQSRRGALASEAWKLPARLDEVAVASQH